MSIQKSLKNALLTGTGLISWHNNAPVQYSEKQHQYFSAETRTFTQAYAKYSSDFVEAQVQGLDPTDPLAYQTRFLRMADVVKPTAAIQRHFDDYKMILMADRDIEYIMPGSKIVTLGNTWLVVNPMNVSGSDGSALVRRCNAVWNFLDFYGNVVSEPIVAENERANANDSDAQNSQLISKGYFNILCQYNDNTRQIDTNTRMILGSGAYRITGFSDFEMEFTGDYSSVRMLSFTARYEVPNDVIDDMVNHVAGGKSFAWNIRISGPEMLRVGASSLYSAVSVRNGCEGGIYAVSGSLMTVPEGWNAEGKTMNAYGAEVNGNTLTVPGNAATYIWQSGDESVFTVAENGIVTGVGEGSAVLTVTLAENPEYSASIVLTVTQTQDGVSFTETPPQRLGAYESATITAAYFEDGAETDEALIWVFTGAEDAAFSYEVSPDGKSVSIRCFGYSATPLTVTATYGSDSAQTQIQLEGF